MPYNIFVIGVGGTGGSIARDLPKMLVGSQHQLTLIDGDSIEKKNIARQPFQSQDIRQNKARVLARKINSLYAMKVEAKEDYLTDVELFHLASINPQSVPFIIGCVDNDATRKILEKNFKMFNSAVYIDCANGEYEGNIYITTRRDGEQFGRLRSEVYPLAEDKLPTERACGAQLDKGNLQFFITNNKVASIALEHIWLILSSEGVKTGVSSIERFKTFHY